VLAYAFGRRHEVFLQLKELLEPLELEDIVQMAGSLSTTFTEVHEVGKRKTQKIERKHLRLRTRIKRLARKTICFSKSELMQFSHWIIHQSL